MKQVVQNYRTGELKIEDVPVPMCNAGGVLVRTAFSLVSAGTERMKVGQARMNLVQKARARPDKVRQVIANVSQVGLAATVAKVRERLGALTPLGYSLAGIVEEVGAGIDELQVGDRVACAGEGIACHAEFAFVPRNLCTLVPDGVDLKDAAFATVGAIAINGVRQAGVGLGDSVVVIGLGLVGLLGVQILNAAGCRVIGMDIDPGRVELARTCGADVALIRADPSLEDTILHVTDGLGADAVYIAASTKSTDPMELAGRILRDRGTVVLVGMTPIQADWQVYYRKELRVVMARSYGPGRYDANYEQKGHDYPVGYVRWTERRNLQEFVRLLEAKRVHPKLLAPELFPFESAPQAYQKLNESEGDTSVALLFEYPKQAEPRRTIALVSSEQSNRPSNGQVAIGMIGAGNFATATLIPALKQISSVRLKGICSSRGLSARSAGGRHGFEYCASDPREILDDSGIDAVIIATRHDTHARLTTEALRAGKHVFVEKPLALTGEELDEVIQAQAETGKMVVPGFNRRFSPLSKAVRDFFSPRKSPIEVICRVNAGAIQSDSWYKDNQEGGWRIVSEGCHFIDLIQYICGCPPARVFAEMIGGGQPNAQNDTCIVTMKMVDGSLGTLIYVANGDTKFEKERIEVFGQSKTAVIQNFQRARLYCGGGSRRVRKAAGKGHVQEMLAFVTAVRLGQPAPISMQESAAATWACLQIQNSLASGTSKSAVLGCQEKGNSPC